MSTLSSLSSTSPVVLPSTTSTNSSSNGSTSTNSSSSSQGPSLAVSGLASGLDDNAIINALLAPDNAQLTLLQNRQQTITTDQTAYQSLAAQMTGLQNALEPLVASQNSVFDGNQATVSNSSLLSATASNSAVPGIYTLQINNLAQAEQIASQGFTSASSTLTQGTFGIQVGAGPETTITINSTNDTLQGLANAINNSGSGVTATIVNDGSRNQPYRLLLAANQPGADNTINITNNLGADANGAIQPVFNANYINQAVVGSNYTGTSVPTVNSGAGQYTGTSNNTYTFTVVNGGTVGTDNNITLSYKDSTGQNTGTIALNSNDVSQPQAVAQGLQVQFGSGTLVAGQTFSVDAFVPVVQAAQSASITLGSGSGALTVQSDSNQVSNVINGVTLNLAAAAPGTPVSITVSSNTSGVTQALQDMVSAYNSVMQTINSDIAYDSDTNTAGPLLGDANVLQMQNSLENTFSSAVSGANPLMNQLSDLGITVNSDGTLSLNTTTLNNVLSGQVAGVTFNDVRNLFALSGNSDNASIQFVGATDQTATGSAQVNITRAATQASMTAGNALASSIVINGSNNTLAMKVDGAMSSTITLPSGTYTPASLAAALQAQVNANSQLSGRQVSVGLNGSQLVVTSATYGSNSQVSIGTGTALATLGFVGNEGGSGTDVAGNFVVNGVTEPATGFGQFLVGNSGNAHTDGLEVQSTVTGSGTISVTRGLADALNQSLSIMLNPVSGTFQQIDQNFQQSYNTLQDEITEQQSEIDGKRQQLVDEYSSMEATVSQLQSASGYLGTQLTSLYNPGNSTGSSSSSTNSSASPIG